MDSILSVALLFWAVCAWGAFGLFMDGLKSKETSKIVVSVLMVLTFIGLLAAFIYKLVT